MLHLRVLCEHLPLVTRIQMSLRMRTGTSRNATWSSSRHHAWHHWSCLADLWSSRSCNSGVHLWAHRNSRLLASSWYTLGRRVALRHWVTAMDCHSRWVLREWLRHAHHVWCSQGTNASFHVQILGIGVGRVWRHQQEIQTVALNSVSNSVLLLTCYPNPPVSCKNAPTARRSLCLWDPVSPFRPPHIYCCWSLSPVLFPRSLTLDSADCEVAHEMRSWRRGCGSSDGGRVSENRAVTTAGK